MAARRRPRRTNLFLVRVWTEDTIVADSSGASENAVCRGKVQSLVDGESYRFDNQQELLALLATLIPGGAPGEPDETVPDR